MQTYMEESLQRDIDGIRGYVNEMFLLAHSALNNCVKALRENNRQLAYAVILRDQYINEKEKEIDRLCLEFLVRQQPVAGPLRFAYSTIRINLEIERIGDYAESIAHNILKISDFDIGLIKDDIAKLAELSISMFRDAVTAFIKQDPELARNNIGCEEAVDALRSQLNDVIIKLLKEQSIPYEVFAPLTTIVRRFERVADQARNISMEALYMCTGEYAKHPNTQAFRILFFDKYNSCQSQMAEAIANALNVPKFIFASAGLEPRSIDAATQDFMKSKGHNLMRMAPKSITQIPHLDYYQVIVSLARETHAAFPEAPRKVIMLDWQLDDPSAVQGSAETIRDAYEKAYHLIESRIKELVNAVIGAEKTTG